MKINSPTVGPIIGYTTTNQCRIFVRGQDERDGAGFRRCFVVTRWKRLGGKAWSAPIFNKLSPNFDMTGVTVLSGLAADTEYEYQSGWFFADSELDKVQSFDENQFEWPSITYKFKTGSGDAKAQRSYIVGSCRYLLRLFGGTYFDDRGDKAFRSILSQIDDDKMFVDALLMIGDQIYADDLAVVSPDTRLDQFLERYRTVFSQENVQKLMARVPTYMILDDHEIEDNWPAKASSKDRVTLYPNAIHAYQIYQCSHGPLFDATKEGRIDGTLKHFWYTFSDGCADWFIIDARTERIATGQERQLINSKQMDALLSWLDDGSGKIKFIVSSVPVFPDLNGDADDKWGAFPSQRAQLIDHIYKKKTPKVVFVSGDVHCSFVAKLTSKSDPTFSIISIVSSSFFWPYPHTDQSDFLFGLPLTNTGAETFTSKLLSPIYSEDNFARIEAGPTELQISFFERKGDRLGKVLKLQL